MNKKYIKALSVLAIALIILPLIPSTVHIARAQTVSIVNYKKAVSPGGILWVEINVLAANQLVVINVTNSAGTTAWATISRTFLSPGTYNITMQLPKVLPGIGSIAPAQAVVNVESGGVPASNSPVTVNITPIVVVEPSVTTDVNATGYSQSITVYGYGFPEGISATTVNVTAPFWTSSYKYWTVSAISNSSGVMVISGLKFNKLINSTTNSADPWLPRGTYSVYITTDNSIVNGVVVPGSLTISPIAIITPSSGNGEYTQKITVEGYGFDPHATINYIELVNENFTRVEYKFSEVATSSTEHQPLTADKNGHFVAHINTESYPHMLPLTNMSAGLYMVNITWSSSRSFTNVSTMSEVKSTSAWTIFHAVNVASDHEYVTVNASLYLNASEIWTLTTKKSVSSYKVVAEFTFRGTTFYLVANITQYNLSVPEANVAFYLYNATATPMVLLSSYKVVNATYLTTTSPNYFYAWAAFNTTAGAMTGGNASVPIPSNYLFKAEYWGNVTLNVGNLYIYMRKWVLHPEGSNLTIFYKNTATGTVKKFFFSGVSGNLTLDNATVTASISTISFKDNSYYITISYCASLNLTSNYEKATLSFSETFNLMHKLFRNAAYIVRPILIKVAPGLIKPGSLVKIVAYGYGPGVWGGVTNKLHLLWDEKIPLEVYNSTTTFSGNTVAVGRDGNVTFTVKLPENVTYGAHYLRGKDSFGYEFTIMILVGAQAFWAKASGTLTSLQVTAGYPTSSGWEQLVASTCTSLCACAYCGHKVMTKFSDHLGDVIKVTVSGLTPGTKVKVYFGNILVNEGTASSSTYTTSFIVPPVPEGTYPVKVVTPSGVLIINNFMLPNGTIVSGEPQVVPKVLIVSMTNIHQIPILVGPGFVRVIGTGFPPGASLKSIYVNDTAVMYSVNTEIANWYTDANGILKAYGNLYPGLYIPVLQPGLYKIGLVFSTPSSTEISQPGYVFVVNNLTKVATSSGLKSVESNIMSQMSSTKKEVMSSISSISSSITALGTQVSSLKTSISSLSSKLSSQLSSMSSTLSTIKSDVSTLLSKTSSIASSVSGLSSSLSSISSTLNSVASNVNDVKSGISDLKSYVSSLKSSLSSVLGDTATIKSGIDTLKSMVSNIKLSVDLTPITNKLSSISSQLSSIKSTLGQLSTISSTLSSIKSSVQGAASAASNAASAANAAKAAAQSAASAVNNVKTVLGSKIDSATYVLYVATIFAVLAFIFAILSWATARRVAR